MSPDDLFAGGGTTGRLMAGLDWAATDLGPVGGWPQSLRAAVRIVLSSRYPMLLLWGPRFTQLYNDAYSALIGDQHPAALGGDVRVTLADSWNVLEPLILDAMATGVASWVPALRLVLDRAGYREEAYFSVSHAPARDDDGTTMGVLTVCSEVTDQIVGERRLRLLRDLSLPAGTDPVDVAETCARLSAVIGDQPLDVPFAAIYLRDGGMLRLAACVGADADNSPVQAALPASLSLAEATADSAYPAGDDPWGLRAAAAGRTARTDDVVKRVAVTGGPWGDPVRAAVAQPLPSADREQPVGVVLTGISPSRGLDETYRSFLQLLAQQVAVAVRNAQAYQQERERAEALAELDRVKTGFFTNVSHEFRTPLTLMLGPLADALADRDEPLPAGQRERVDTAWRNANRLLGLVNDLLTFSSLEAGRAGHAPRSLDLATWTAELAGVFRSAVERAGLRLVVDCPPLPRPVAVDPGNWEKIVTNLISNALKFTFVGEIRVTLAAERIRLRVTDTGIGIDAAELPRLFDRFHRVQGVRSRSHEGTGIGLAMVRELSRLQGGDVRAESTPGEGTTFTVTLPWTAVEPVAEPAATPAFSTAEAAVREVTGWLDDAAAGAEAPPAGPAEQLPAARILVADDNSDMRAYLVRLLGAQGWQVDTVADGQAALEAIARNPPDLLLTDVMMPRLDGFGLVRALRREPATEALPVVMLSARAGQEAGVEGLQVGADDYVVKPFTAAELVARVRTTLRLARLRGTHTRQLRVLADTAAVIASGRALEEAFQAATEQARALLGGVRAVTELDGDEHHAPLRFTAPPTGAGDAIADTRTLTAILRGADGRRLGSLAVRVGAASPPADDARALLDSMATLLASLARSTAQLEHERQLTLTLQQSLLPESLPAPEGWDLQAQFRPATGEAGGNWYDVVALPGGDLVLSIGDVAGHGLGAAVTSGQVRNAVRAYAVEDPAPAPVLTRVARLLSRLGAPFSASLLVARLKPATGELSWCSAGHPAPVRSAPGEDTRQLTGTVGPPLGAGTATYEQNEDSLPPGAQLVLFTDGLVATEGLERLLHRAGVSYVNGAAAATVVEAVLTGAAEPLRDDVAVVAVRRRGPVVPAAVAELPEVDATWVYPLAPTAAAAMRRDLRAALSGDRIDPDLLDDLQVAATEAVNNAVEHAQRPSRPEVEVRLQVTDGLVRVVVRDFGGWRQRPPARDRGRGALLMNAYGDVRVTSTATGTTVTIERRWAEPPRQDGTAPVTMVR
ncbi:SpoIIE family protein phosphatase [Actinoplanes sp. NPDC048967]|uniref:SpoIIE family protein phosphatase n=1 Tax=Actinoplanes sp. NPDC048967 TaxID=3155269 RepID=UPI003406873D